MIFNQPSISPKVEPRFQQAFDPVLGGGGIGGLLTLINKSV